MTDTPSGAPSPADEAAVDLAPAGPSEDGSTPLGSPGRALGLFRFTIEGRSAPGLFVAGWIGLLVGGGAAFVGLLAGRSLPATLLFVGGLAVLLVALMLLGGSQTLERRKAGLAYAGPAPILTFAALVVGWYLGAIAVVTPLQLLGFTLSGTPLLLVGITIQALVVIAILRVMVVGSGAMSWAEMGLRRPDVAAVRDFAWGALLAYPVVLLTGVVILGLITVIGQQPASPLPPTGTTEGLVLNLLMGALIAPAYEELFFRGFVMTAWRRMNGPRQAILRSAILFAAIHVIDQTGTTFASAAGVALVAAGARLPVALALGWVYQRRGSLWGSIGLHATFNAILIVIAERAFAG